MDPFDQGKHAAGTPAANPYSPEEDAYDDWNAGYQAGLAEDDEDDDED